MRIIRLSLRGDPLQARANVITPLSLAMGDSGVQHGRMTIHHDTSTAHTRTQIDLQDGIIIGRRTLMAGTSSSPKHEALPGIGYCQFSAARAGYCKRRATNVICNIIHILSALWNFRVICSVYLKHFILANVNCITVSYIFES